MDISSLHEMYAAGQQAPEEIVNHIYDRIAAEGLQPIWISLVARKQALARVERIKNEDRTKLPLFGIPFAVKDNIDVAGLPTTAACPDYSYSPTESATVVTRLEQAGAILIGKTNMDQFATGLVGTRTPYGVCSSVFNKNFISGGSSSGSAVAVASGLVSFSLGTDTAGSGRVPAMFNNLIGLKPTRGILSTFGVVPACRSLDCVSIFTETALDASLISSVARGFDIRDPYSRIPGAGTGASPWMSTTTFEFGVPISSALEFYGDADNPILYQKAVDALIQLGGIPVEFDPAPFLAAAQLLYQGSWVAERYAAISEFFASNEQTMNLVVAQIISGAKNYSAIDTFNAMYQLEYLRHQTIPIWDSIDFMMLPTAPRTYTIAEIESSPIERNSHLGYYTNFVNLLDLAAVSVPAGMRPDALPFGVSLIGKAFTDDALLVLADRLHRSLGVTLGGSDRKLVATSPLTPSQPPHGCLLMAVVGAHLSGQPLNWQLTQRGGRLLRTCRTSANYKFYALGGTIPPKPGLIHVPSFCGPGIEVEVWVLPTDTVGSFVDAVPPPLSIGTLHLEDGTRVKGFLAEPSAIEDSIEITQMGGWRRYLASLQ